MAEIVSIHGVTHNPLLWRFFSGGGEVPADLVGVREGFTAFEQEVRAARPDVVVVVGTDHMTQFFPDNMPAFLVGKQRDIPAIFWNETREFGIPGSTWTGDTDLAGTLLTGGLDRHFDLAFSNEFRLDHAFVLPMHYMAGELGLPVVPIFTNCIAPPFPRARRFYDLGRMLRDTIESSPLGRRVAVIASGHLSVEIGGPRQFAGAPSPEFDDRVTRWFADGAVDELLERSTYEELHAAGNVTHQFLNFLVTLGMADGAAATTARSVGSRFTASPFYRWEV